MRPKMNGSHYASSKPDNMAARFLSIWFRHLRTDSYVLRNPELRDLPIILTVLDHGRVVITAANAKAEQQGIYPGMGAADARAIIHGLHVADDEPARAEKLLHELALWCIRYSPCIAVDPPDGLHLDISGCAHLWGGETPYLKTIVTRMRSAGYDVRAAIADTVGAAWAHARYGPPTAVIEDNAEALLSLPPAALRLEPPTLDKLHKLGLTSIGQFARMPRQALRRRFGEGLLKRLDQAFGRERETLQPVEPPVPYQERLPCLEPIVTATGIGIALERLLEALCSRLRTEGKGLRTAHLTTFRVDGRTQTIGIGTTRASHHTAHLYRLFEDHIARIEPALGIELFVLEAPTVEDAAPLQEKMWEGSFGLLDMGLAEMLDRITGKLGTQSIKRYLPDEHHWPERSIKQAGSLQEKATTVWRDDRPRPMHLLPRPEPVEVTAPIPDYPPMNFRYKGALHRVKRADGPERIEREWWIEEGEHRDYFTVEDTEGKRYWLFRSGHYDKNAAWYIHGFFA